MKVSIYKFPGINPEPWEIGPVSWRKEPGNPKAIPVIGPSKRLTNYQDAIRDALKKQLSSDILLIEGLVRIEFFFWRRLDTNSGFRYNKPQRTEAKVSDSTNMQKATEDALQKILFHNDNQVKDIRSVIVEEGPDVNSGVLLKIAEIERYSPVTVDHNLLAQFNDERNNKYKYAGLADELRLK